MSEDDLRGVFAGCLLGGAIGDALGAPVEFMTLGDIRQRYGAQGITGYAEVYGRTGAITDDTQMTLFTAEGLIRAFAAHQAGTLDDPIRAIHRAYLRWLHTQGHSSAHPNYDDALDGWLVRTPGLHSQRAPGNTCLGALALPHAGSIEHPLNDSKGCGTVMRMAPVGLWGQDPFELGCRVSALTHGHPTGYLAGGIMAVLVAYVVAGASVREAVAEALGVHAAQLNDEVISSLRAALELSSRRPLKAEDLQTLGEGWVAEEALAIGVCAAIAAESFEHGVALAVNHSGDSDSTGSIAGHLLGAAGGIEALPVVLMGGLELAEEIIELAHDLATAHAGVSPDPARYPPR